MSFKGSHHSVETREKMRQAKLGKHASLETRDKIRQAALGRKHTPETREKMRLAHLGNKRCLGRKLTPQTRAKMRQAALGKPKSPEHREKLRQARLKQHFPTKMTSIERILYAEFKKRRLHFEMHKTMFGRWQPDFVFEEAKLIVEADGDYWHNLPKARIREAAMRDLALADGWTLWRFGEKQIHMHPAACGRAVARFVRDH